MTVGSPNAVSMADGKVVHVLYPVHSPKSAVHFYNIDIVDRQKKSRPTETFATGKIFLVRLKDFSTDKNISHPTKLISHPINVFLDRQKILDHFCPLWLSICYQVFRYCFHFFFLGGGGGFQKGVQIGGPRFVPSPNCQQVGLRDINTETSPPTWLSHR